MVDTLKAGEQEKKMKKTINRKIVKEKLNCGVKFSIYEVILDMEWPIKTYLRFDDGEFIVPYTWHPLTDAHPMAR